MTTDLEKIAMSTYPIESYFSPYRGDLCEDLLYILKGDYKKVTNAIHSRGIRFLIATTLVMTISSLKCINYAIQHYSKPECPAPDLPRDKVNSMDRQYYYALENNKYLTDIYAPNHEIKSKRADALNELREILYENDFKLKGYILKVTNHRVSDEDFLESARTGIIQTPFSTTQVTFGERINELLSRVFPEEITLKKRKKFNDTYVIFKGDDYGFLDEYLRKLYWIQVSITFDDISHD